MAYSYEKYLTDAQKRRLKIYGQQLSNQNAGVRAEAEKEKLLGTREAERYLQNRGLAGAYGENRPKSGEVDRVRFAQDQVMNRTNETLRNKEQVAINAQGIQFANQTIARRNAAAQKKAEEAYAAALKEYESKKAEYEKAIAAEKERQEKEKANQERNQDFVIDGFSRFYMPQSQQQSIEQQAKQKAEQQIKDRKAAEMRLRLSQGEQAVESARKLAEQRATQIATKYGNIRDLALVYEQAKNLRNEDKRHEAVRSEALDKLADAYLYHEDNVDIKALEARAQTLQGAIADRQGASREDAEFINRKQLVTDMDGKPFPKREIAYQNAIQTFQKKRINDAATVDEQMAELYRMGATDECIGAVAKDMLGSREWSKGIRDRLMQYEKGTALSDAKAEYGAAAARRDEWKRLISYDENYATYQSYADNYKRIEADGRATEEQKTEAARKAVEAQIYMLTGVSGNDLRKTAETDKALDEQIARAIDGAEAKTTQEMDAIISEKLSSGAYVINTAEDVDKLMLELCANRVEELGTAYSIAGQQGTYAVDAADGKAELLKYYAGAIMENGGVLPNAAIDRLAAYKTGDIVKSSQKALDDYSKTVDRQTYEYRIMNRNDFAEKSQYNEEYAEKAWASYGFHSPTNAANAPVGQTFMQNVSYMTEEERTIYNYLFNADVKNGEVTLRDKQINTAFVDVTYGDAAKSREYLKMLEPTLAVRANEQGMGNINKHMQQTAERANGWGLFGLNVASLAIKPMDTLANIATMASAASHGADLSDMTYSKMTDAIRNETEGRIGSKPLKTLYRAGMSAVDNAINNTFGLINPAIPMATMGIEAATSTAVQCAEMGMDEGEIAAISVLSGVAELFFEKFSIESFLDAGDMLDKGKVGKAIGSMFLTNMQEEAATEIANKLTEAMFAGEDGSYMQTVYDYMRGGDTYAEASRKAVQENADDVLNAGIEGGLSAILMSGMQVGRSAARNSAIKKQGAASDVSKIMEQVKALDKNSEAYKLAMELERKGIDNATEREKGDLAIAYVQQARIEAEKAIREATDNREEAVKQLSEVMNELITGGYVNKKMAKTVLKTDGGIEAFNRVFHTNATESTLQKEMENAAARQSLMLKGQMARAEIPIARKNVQPVQAVQQTEETEPKQTAQKGVMPPTPVQQINMQQRANEEIKDMEIRASFTSEDGSVTYALRGFAEMAGATDAQKRTAFLNTLSGKYQRRALLMEALASKMGVNVILHDTMRYSNGFVDAENNMHFALDAEGGVLRVFSHELTHWLQRQGGSAYAAFREHLIADVGQKKFDELVEREIKGNWLKDGETLETAAEAYKSSAENEVIAQLCEAMLNKESAIKAFAKRNTAAAERIRDHIKSFLHMIRDAVKDAQEETDVSTLGDEYIHDMTGCLAKWSKAIDDAVKEQEQEKKQNAKAQLDALTEKARTNKQDGVEHMLKKKPAYDYSKPFAEQVDDWMAGNIPKNDTLLLGGTPMLYQQIGLSALPMTMDQTHIDYAINGTKNADHHMGEALLKQLPELLKRPIAIIESATRSQDSVMAIVKGKVNGHQMMAAVRIGGNGRQNGAIIDSNHIVSAQGRNNAITKLLADAIQKELNGGVGIYYWNKNEALPLTVQSGVQFPGGRINDGLIHSIFDASSPVNRKYLEQTKTQQFKRWFGKSKVINEDGTPKVVYHGTNAEFSVFQSADGAYWFSESEDYAESMMEERGGNRIIQAYLSMQNPYYATLEPGKFSDPNYEKPLIRKAKAEGYDGLIITNDTKNELERDTFYVVFDSRQIKSATENIGTFDGSNPDINFSLRTEIGELTQQVAKMTDEQLNELYSLGKNKKGWYFKDLSRVLDTVAGENKELRDMLHDVIEAPHSRATGLYAKSYRKSVETFKKEMERLNVYDKKSGRYIQIYGEGHYQGECAVDIARVGADEFHVNAMKDGKTVLEGRFSYDDLIHYFSETNAERMLDALGESNAQITFSSDITPYTLEDLKRDRSDWENIVEAEKIIRNIYDGYAKKTNAMLSRIYPYVFDKATDREEKIDKQIALQNQYIEAEEQRVQEKKRKLEEKQKELDSKNRKDTKKYAGIQKSIARLQMELQDANRQIEYHRSRIAEYNVMKQQLVDSIQKGDSLSHMRRVEYRRDYFHHYQEQSGKNLIRDVRQAWRQDDNISPAIVGKTDQTKPKSKWVGWQQQRGHGAYTENAIGGMLKYMQEAEYKLAYDPLIASTQELIRQIRKYGIDLEGSRNANDRAMATNMDEFIQFLEDWVNMVAGKTDAIARQVNNRVLGRRVGAVLNVINSHFIRNTLYFNLRSSLVQISNLTNAVSIIKNPIDWISGMRLMGRMRKSDALKEVMESSNFINRRYMETERLTEGCFNKLENFAAWMLGIGDQISGKLSWWAAYSQYTRHNGTGKMIESMGRSYDSAVDYADDVVRRTHGGRGEGELAPVMNNKLLSFFAPFQVEVNNTFLLLKEQIGKKNALGIVEMECTIFLMNTLFQAIVGDTPLGFDFIRAILEIIMGAVPDEDEDPMTAGEVALMSLQRIGGEAMSGIPFAAQLASMLLGEENSKALFGEEDPTRYGTVNIGFGGILDVGKQVVAAVNGDFDWQKMLGAMLPAAMPMGGKQLSRSIVGTTDFIRGYSSKVGDDGEQIQFSINRNVFSGIKSVLFGKWSLDEAQQYMNGDTPAPWMLHTPNEYRAIYGQILSPEETEAYKEAVRNGMAGRDFFRIRADIKSEEKKEDKRRVLLNNGSLSIEQKIMMDRQLIEKKGTDELFTEGTAIYRYSFDEDGEYKLDDDGNKVAEILADYGSEELFNLSQLGINGYRNGLNAENHGISIPDYIQAAEAAKGAKRDRESMRAYIYGTNLPADKKAYLEGLLRDTDKVADYSSPEAYALSNIGENTNWAERSKMVKESGVTQKEYLTYVQAYTSSKEKSKEKGGEDEEKAEATAKAELQAALFKDTTATPAQRFLIYQTIAAGGDWKQTGNEITHNGETRYVFDGGVCYGFDKEGKRTVYQDWRSAELLEISKKSDAKWYKAQDAMQIGMSLPEFSKMYDRINEIKGSDAKDKKARVREYLNGLPISKQQYDFLWKKVGRYK